MRVTHKSLHLTNPSRGKTLRARARTNNKLNPHIGIEPGPHCSHHRAIPAPQVSKQWETETKYSETPIEIQKD